ncbi:hypothetical protein [Rhodococcus koreensis]
MASSVAPPSPGLRRSIPTRMALLGERLPADRAAGEGLIGGALAAHVDAVVAMLTKRAPNFGS